MNERIVHERIFPVRVERAPGRIFISVATLPWGVIASDEQMARGAAVGIGSGVGRGTMMDALIPLAEEHRRLEKIIERGRQTFIEVGSALMTIREKRTYVTEGYDTFEEYCRERWGWTRQRAYQLMDAAEVTADLSKRFDTPPTNAGQAEAASSWLRVYAAAVRRRLGNEQKGLRAV